MASQSTAGMHRARIHYAVLVPLAAVTLFVIYILTNAPSASTAKLAEINAQNNFPESNAAVAGIIPESDFPKILRPIASGSIVQQSSFKQPDHEQSDQRQLNVNQPDIKPDIMPLEWHALDAEPTSDQASEADASKLRLTAQLQSPPQSQPWITTQVRNGDSLSQIFNRNHLGVSDAYRLARLEDAKPLLKIRPGQEIKIKKDQQGKLALLQYQINTFDTLTVQPIDDRFVVEITKREPEIRLNNAKATIQHNLLGAAKKSRISLHTMYNFIALFGWQVDFSMDLRAGDQFSIIYEEHYLDDEKIGDGEIIAAELVLSGKILQAIRHEDKDGHTRYYAPDGGGIESAFLRTPLKFGYITSNFSNNRLHPVKKIWSAHKGVDYGAPRGTPVLTTGDGKIRLAGGNGGYGKTIIIRHGGKYETVYAHLSGYAKGIRSGVRVKQGEIIGYVGSTGLATGPHLHYEFRINGVHKNPRTVALPTSDPIPEKSRAQFQQTAGLWVAELEYLNRALAQNNVDTPINQNLGNQNLGNQQPEPN
ncbi:peptidoglycan DD-metalloendopeptidase family protein [Candidatus Spongiihabitans sp.]|uniref:peptidoglycan DD-metalloendopeptidase family protein n=1 Tax=Candidatus Spongiihabitans sp. TaxID=3101308 RepID=UPI003C7E2129